METCIVNQSVAREIATTSVLLYAWMFVQIDRLLVWLNSCTCISK